MVNVQFAEFTSQQRYLGGAWVLVHTGVSKKPIILAGRLSMLGKYMDSPTEVATTILATQGRFVVFRHCYNLGIMVDQCPPQVYTSRNWMVIYCEQVDC